MSNDDLSFIDLCLTGKARPEDIDDFVEAWHQGVGVKDLRDHLGMTSDQYWRWVCDPDQFKAILAEHQFDKSLKALATDVGSMERMEFIGPDASHALLEGLKRMAPSDRTGGHAQG